MTKYAGIAFFFCTPSVGDFPVETTPFSREICYLVCFLIFPFDPSSIYTSLRKAQVRKLPTSLANLQQSF
jgi:hypothetical protein